MGLWVTEQFKDLRSSFRVRETLFSGTSPYQKVDIVDTITFGRMLLLDDMVMTTEKDEFVYHEMISHVPLLVHPNPKRVLVIGGGDGGTVREILKHPEVEEVVLCEIDDMVIDACREFLPTIAVAFDHPKLTLNIGDGVTYMAEKAENFDLIIIDSTDPVGPGEGLFTKAFYENVTQALNPDGMMVAQTESPFTDQSLIEKIYPFYRSYYPIVRMYLGHIPTYPGGMWSWCFCSKRYEPQLTQAHMERARAIEKTCRYFNIDMFQSSFSLPNFVQTMIKEKAPTSC